MWHLVGLLVACLCHIQAAQPPEVIHQWNLLNFNFPYDYDLTKFRPENTVFTGLEMTKDRVFVSMPRLREGVPATLASMSTRAAPGSSPVLQAYPDWSFHSSKNGNVTCNGLVSVYRIRQDSCNRLWVLDSGVMTSLDNFRRICPPKLMIFDLRTDRLVRNVLFPEAILRPNSLLTNLVIDESVQGTCDSSFVYITDTAAPGLVVYNAAADTAWRFMHPTMFPDPNFSDYNVAGETFTLMDGIVGLTHSPKLATLYFQPLATNRIFSVRTDVLRKGPPAENEALPIELVGKKSSQGLGLAVNENDETLYFSPLSETSVASYNPVTGQNRLESFDTNLLQFPAEIRWNHRDGSVWLLTTRFQKFFLRTLNANEINFRIVRLRPETALNFHNSLYY